MYNLYAEKEIAQDYEFNFSWTRVEGQLDGMYWKTSAHGLFLHLTRIRMECPIGHNILNSPTRVLLNFIKFLH